MDSHDVHQLIASGLVDPNRLLELFSSIEDQIYRYPSVDAKSFRQAVERLVEGAKPESREVNQ